MQELLPQYEISRLIGHGGMGAVYEGVQANLQRKVAIKLLPESLGTDEDGLNFTDRFKLEARSMANLDHPGIISVYDFGETSEGQLYFVMEFIDGMDIHQYLRHHGGKLPAESAIAITAHVLDALGYAHERGIIHRDIKPANIMIKSDGRVKVADFGLVKRLSETGEGSPDSAALTMTNVAIGTPDFVAPESLEIGRAVDHRADLYAIEVMFYQMLTGTVPRGNFKPPSGKIPELDSRLDAIVMRAMEAEPEDRYASADDFRAAIDEILSAPVPEDEGTEAVLPPPAEEHTSPVTPGGKRLHITAVQKKSSAPKGSTGPVKGRRPSSVPPSRRGAAPVKKPNTVLMAALVVIGLAVVGGVAAIFLGGSGDDTSATSPEVAEAKGKAGGGGKSQTKGKGKGSGEQSKSRPPAPKPPVTVAENTKPTPKPPELEPDPVTPAPPDPDPAPATPAPEPDPAEDPVAKRLAEIDEQYRDFFEKPYAEALSTLNTQFTGALKREEQAASGTGNLDLVLAFQNEAKRIGNGQGAGPADAADIPPKLKQWRTTWHTQHQQLLDQQAANRKEAHARRDRALDLYQQELVKEQDIAAAQRVKALREQFAANPEAGVAATAIAGVPPGPVRSGGPGNPLLPVISDPPKLEYPPKRPTRKGDVIAFDIADSNAEPEVLASDVVAFKTLHPSSKPFVFALKSSGELQPVGHAHGSPVVDSFKTFAAKLTDVAEFGIDPNRRWGLALSETGKVIRFASSAADSRLMNPPQDHGEICDVFATTTRGNAVTSSGEVISWTPNGTISKATPFQSVARLISMENGEVKLGLTTRGSLTLTTAHPRLSEADQRDLDRVRTAVRIAMTTTKDAIPILILHEDGTVQPIAWPRDRFENGDPLPQEMPKDIEAIYVGQYQIAPKTESKLIGGVLSRSQGWIFFGDSGGVDFDKLAQRVRGCFQIETSGLRLYGLRDPQSAANPTPPVSITPPTPTPRPANAGNPNQPVITEVPKLEYPPKRPQRAGDLIGFRIMDENAVPEVLASDVVAFEGDENHLGALTLTESGELRFAGRRMGGHFSTTFDAVAPRLKDIVSFSIDRHRNWAVASNGSGKIIALGGQDKGPLINPPKGWEVCQVFVRAGRGLALLASGEILVWHYSGTVGIVPNLERVTHLTGLLALDTRGHLKIASWNNIPAEFREEIDRIRKAVRVVSTKSGPMALVLEEDGEVIPIGWPEDQFPNGNPLPPDLPKDIENLSLGVYPAPGANQKVLGGILSRSQGWIFFGDSGGVDFDKLADRARGCFQIQIRAANFYGLRDPVKPSASAAGDPVQALGDPPD